MFAVFFSSKEKSIKKVLLKKTKPNCWEQILFSVPFSVYFWLNGWVETAFHKKHRGLQLIKVSSEGDRPLLSAGLLLSDQSYRTLDESLIRTLLYGCLLAEPTSLIKKTKKGKNALEVVPDQTQLRSKAFLIRPKCARWGYDQTQLRSKSPLIRQKCARRGYDQTNCARSRLWSDKSALEEVMIRPNCARIRLWSDISDQNDLWSDHLQTMVQTVVRSNFRKDPVISVWEHTGVRSTGSDHNSIWVWTSTWVKLY